MAAADGTVWASDGRGACTRVAPDGSHEERLGALGEQLAEIGGGDEPANLVAGVEDQHEVLVDDAWHEPQEVI